MGRTGTPVIPAGWSAGHAAVVAKTLTSTVSIAAPDTGDRVYNSTTHQSETPTPEPVYVGAAEIMLVSDSDQLPDVAGEDVPVRRYEVKLPASAAEVVPGHVVTVTACADPDLAGASLVVVAVERGGQRFSRVLHTTLTH